MLIKKNLSASLRQLGVDACRLTDDRLNLGGCCVFAFLVANKLAEKGIKARGVVFNRHSDIPLYHARPKNSNSVWAWNDNGVAFEHVALEFRLGRDKRMIFDSNGFHYPEVGIPPYGKPLKGYLSVKELEGLAEDTNWNCMFDRNQIPDLQELVETSL